MKKKIKKYISGSIVAALLLTAMPLQTVADVNSDNSGNIENVEKEEFLSVGGEEGNILNGANCEIVSDNIAEGDSAIEKSASQDTVFNYQKETVIISESENMIENSKTSENFDSEDVTADFIDPAFQLEIRQELGLSDSEPITKSVCADVEVLSLYNKDIKSLEGIKNLINLAYLDCNRNQLTSLDVSGCTNLKKLECSERQLTNLDVSGCTNLTYLFCSGNQLTSLDVSGCTNLTYLECSGSQLTSLDVSGCTNLTYLECSENQLTSLDVSDCTNLTYLFCSGNQLTSLNVSGCTGLGYLYCNRNQLTSLNVNDALGLVYLHCDNNRLVSLDIKKCRCLLELSCRNNQLTSLDIRGCDTLLILSCIYNNMRSPDDVKGRIREFNGEDFVFYPQNKNTNIPIIPTASPTAKPILTPAAPPKTKKPQKPTVTPKSYTLYVDGKPKTLKVSGAKGRVTYKSSKPKVAKVDSKGKVTPKSSGRTTITIKIAGNSSYKSATIKVTVKVMGVNVTNKYKVKTQKMLCNFDQYFGYCCGKGAIFKYDVYARTNMLSIPNLHKILGKSTKYAKDELSDEMKLFFGTASVKYKKFSSRYKWWKDPTYIVVSKNGKVEYTSGNWGWGVPRGKVTKIIKTNNKKYIVTYKVYRYNSYEKKVMYDMGAYKITMKKANNKNGFIITKIERTQTNNVPL